MCRRYVRRRTRRKFELGTQGLHEGTVPRDYFIWVKGVGSQEGLGLQSLLSGRRHSSQVRGLLLTRHGPRGATLASGRAGGSAIDELVATLRGKSRNR